MREPLTQIALVLIAAQLALRGWALAGSWFYGDDFVLLLEARENGIDPGFWLTPHDSQLMPGGRIAAWIVTETGTYNWLTAAAIVLLFQALASLACWWMLRTLFGQRPAILLLLGLYLLSPMTLTAFMWWAAAINAVPLQLAFFLAVTFHVRYLRERRRIDAVGSIASQVLGLFFFVKAVLIVLPLFAIAVLWFCDTSLPWHQRPKDLLVRYRGLTIANLILAAAYVGYYMATTPNPIAAQDRTIAWGDLADSMLRVSLPVSLFGGPWEWDFSRPPVGIVGTPGVVVTAVWVGVAIMLTVLWSRRAMDVRALAVAVPYVLLSYVLLARGRGVFLGGFAGLELRYLADTLPVLVLGIGLLLLPLRTDVVPRATATPPVDSPTDESDQAAGAGSDPSHPSRWRRAASLGVVAALAIGAVWSTVDYGRTWQQRNLSGDFTRTVIRESETAPLRVVDVALPPEVVSPLLFPANLPSRFFSPLGEDSVRAFLVGNDLQMLDAWGVPRDAAVAATVEAPAGPDEGCGYAITESPTRVPMEGTAPYFWWMEISYLAAVDTEIEVRYGTTEVTHPVPAGPHRLFLQGGGDIDHVRLATGDDDALLCVDRVKVGAVEPVIQ